jgi:F0F1-type ATP synthase membrane subunit b/b'
VSDLGDEYTESEARVSRIFDRLNQRIGAIIMGAADDAVKGVTDQLTKASAEIQAEVQKLQDAGVSDDALAGLKDVAQSLDDRTPDAAPTDAPGDAGTNVDTATDTSE